MDSSQHPASSMPDLHARIRQKVSADILDLRRTFYVALNLEQLSLAAAHELVQASETVPPVMEHEGTAYYHLTPAHFAWLHRRMHSAQRAYSAGHLDASAWATARMLWREVLEKATRAYGMRTLNAAVRGFTATAYHLPTAAGAPSTRGVRATQATSASGIPAACPYDAAYLARAAAQSPNLVPCPASRPAWWWIEKRWCDTKCRGHPLCIRHVYWGEQAHQKPSGVQV